MVAQIRGGWNVEMSGAPEVRHFWQRDRYPDGGDLAHVAFGPSYAITLTMDREALDAVRAELDAVAAEWDRRVDAQAKR